MNAAQEDQNDIIYREKIFDNNYAEYSMGLVKNAGTLDKTKIFVPHNFNNYHSSGKILFTTSTWLQMCNRSKPSDRFFQVSVYQDFK